MLTTCKNAGMTLRQLNEYSLLANRAIEIKNRHGQRCIDIRPRFTRVCNKYSSKIGDHNE